MIVPSRTGLLQISALLAVLMSSPLLAQPQLLGPGWQFRRQLTVRNAPSDAASDPIGVAEFYTNGQQLPDGADIRVTTPDRRVMPMKIMEIVKDRDFVRVAFLARDPGPYSVWWGQQNPGNQPPTVEIKRGVLAEIYRFPGGAVDNEQQMEKTFERAGEPVASMLVPEIFVGYHPLGEPWSPMIRYRGQFKVDRAGEYDIAMSVDDSGYVRIDGKTLLTLTNTWMEGQGRWHKTITLSNGWHAIEAAQIDNRGGDTGITIGWKPTGVARYSTIAAATYAPTSTVTVGPLETMGKSYTADFTVDASGECFTAPDFYLPRYSFEAIYSGPFAAKFQWDFGDGQTATTPKVSHVFLTPGTYPIKLTVSVQGNTFTTTQRIAVKDRLYQRFPVPPEDTPRASAQILAAYDVKTLNIQQLWRGLQLLKMMKDDSVLPWARAWLENRTPQPESVVWQEAQDLAEFYRARKQYRQLADAFTQIANKNVGIELRATAIRHAVLTLCDEVNDPDAGLKLARGFKDKNDITNREAQRTLSLAVAYAAIACGDGKLATKVVEEVGPRRDLAFNEQEIQQGVLTRNVETYTRAKDFQTADKLLDQWERDYPQTLITGFTRLMAVKLQLEQGQFAAAARLAEQHARALPGTFYAAELLYHARNAYSAAGDAQAAKRCSELLTSKYPESPYARKDK